MWRLDITGPQDIKPEAVQKAEKARNTFMVRTRGDVDLYVKPEPVTRVRGLRLCEPHFGGSSSHEFTLQNLDAMRLRFNLLRVSQNNASSLQLGAVGANGTRFVLNHDNDDRLKAGLALEAIEFAGQKVPALLPLHVQNVQGDYGLGVESGARLFFSQPPLMHLSYVAIETRDAHGKPVAARVEITSIQADTPKSP